MEAPGGFEPPNRVLQTLPLAIWVRRPMVRRLFCAEKKSRFCSGPFAAL